MPELHPCIFRCELPIDTLLLAVSICIPGFKQITECFKIWYSICAYALPAQSRQLDFCNQ